MTAFDLRQFEALVAVDDTGSIAAAARRLGWSQPTVNHHLDRLSGIVGWNVVERSASGTALTANARQLEPTMREVLQRCDDMADDVETAGERRRLRLGVFPTLGSLILPSIVRTLRQTSVDVQATFGEISTLIPKLQRGELDAAFVYALHGHVPEVDRRWRIEPVMIDPFVLAVPTQHPLASAEHIGISQLRTLSEEGWVLGTTPDDPADIVTEQWCAQAGFQPHVVLRTDNYRVAMSMIAAELAVGVVSSVGTRFPREGVVRVPIVDRSLARDIVFVVRKPWSQSPIVDSICRTALETLAG